MKRIIFLLAFFMFAGFALQAQTVQITGSVTSAEDGSPLPGVSVVVRGTTIGTITNANGSYVLNVPATARTLVYSFIGLRTVEVEIANQTIINVVMEVDILGLDEVLVVAYGLQTRESKTGSVGIVSADQIANIPETSFEKMLAGRVAGLVVSQESGQPGSGSSVRIRGNSSIFAGNQPLYVVDGIPIMSGNQTYFMNTGTALSMINPNDIESITVLKDAAAAAIYGSRAANGVILITTKSGQSGKSKFNVRVSTGIDQLANDNNFGRMDPDDYYHWSRAAVKNVGGNPDDPGNARYYFPEALLDTTKTNWLDELTRVGRIYNAELSAEGGTETTTHFFSGGYEKIDGIFYGVDYEKFNFRTNIDHKLNDRLRLGTRITGATTNSNDIAMQNLFFVNPIFAGMLLSPYRPVYNEDGTYFQRIGEWSNTNPRAAAEFDEQWEKQNRFNGNIYLDFRIADGLTARTTNSYEYTGGEGRRYWSPYADPTTDLGTLQSSSSKYLQYTTSNTLNYTRLFGDHSVQAIAGQEATRFTSNSYYILSPNVDPEIPYPTTSAAADDNASYAETAFSLESYFGILYYNWDNKYYLQASLRRDGSSRFGADTKWGNFWAVAGSWNIHNEDFARNITPLNMLKLRASYGLSGNYNIGNYDQFGLYGSMQYNGNTGFAPTQPASADLGWETNREYNIGLDYAVFQRFSGTLDFYTRFTEDMLMNYPLSRTSGFASIRQNIGSMKNTGLEFMVNYAAVRTADLRFDLGFNFAYNISEILDLGKDEEFISPTLNRIIHRKGESLYSFYLRDYAGVNPANGEALWWTEDPETGERGELTNVFSQAREFIAGSPEPKFTGGLNPTISWRGLMLDVNLEYKLGHQVLIEEGRFFNSDGWFWLRTPANTALDYWKAPGDITQNPKPRADNATESNAYRNTRFMYNGDYLRIKNITLAYNLPSSLINYAGISNMRIYGSAVNLYTFHNVDYFDPERGIEGVGFGIHPLTKRITFGLELTF